MTNTRFPTYIDTAGRSIDPVTIDLDQALLEGRRQRAMAFCSLFKNGFRGLFGDIADQRDQKPALSHDDCAAAA